MFDPDCRTCGTYFITWVLFVWAKLWFRRSYAFPGCLRSNRLFAFRFLPAILADWFCVLLQCLKREEGAHTIMVVNKFHASHFYEFVVYKQTVPIIIVKHLSDIRPRSALYRSLPTLSAPPLSINSLPQFRSRVLKNWMAGSYESGSKRHGLHDSFSAGHKEKWMQEYKRKASEVAVQFPWQFKSSGGGRRGNRTIDQQKFPWKIHEKY